MALQHGDEQTLWKGRLSSVRLRLKAALGQALDLVFPPQALDGGARALTHGLSAQAWSRIHFIAEPLCDGCGQTPLLTMNKPKRSLCRRLGRRCGCGATRPSWRS